MKQIQILKNFNKIAVLVSILVFTFACEKRDTTKGEMSSALLSIATSAGAPTKVTDACRGAVVVLNTCIAEGYGFNPAVMCHKDVTGYFTEAQYGALADCAAAVKATTSCHLNQNKFPNAQSAFSNSTFITAGVSGTTSFSSCNTTATDVKGQTINIMVY